MSKRTGVPLLEVIVMASVLTGLLIFASREYRAARLKADAHILRQSGIRCTTHGTQCIHAYVNYTNFGDDDFDRLDPMGSFEEFNAGFSHVTPEGLRKVPAPENIVALDVTAMLLDDSNLEILQRFPNLRKLDLTGTLITDEGLTILAGFRELEELSLQQCRVTNEGLSLLKGLNQLTTLNVAFTEATTEGIEAAGGFDSLQHVTIWPRPKTDRDWPFEIEVTRQLAEMRGLVKIHRPREERPAPLKIRLQEDIAERFPDLARFSPHTWHLHIPWSSFSDSDMPVMRQFLFVTTLQIGRTQVTDEGLRELRDRYYLTRITLPRKITDAGLDHVRRLPMLEFLDLSGTQVTDDGLAKLHNVKSLEWIALTGSRVTVEGVIRFRQLRPEVRITSDFKIEPDDQPNP